MFDGCNMDSPPNTPPLHLRPPTPGRGWLYESRDSSQEFREPNVTTVVPRRKKKKKKKKKCDSILITDDLAETDFETTECVDCERNSPQIYRRSLSPPSDITSENINVISPNQETPKKGVFCFSDPEAFYTEHNAQFTATFMPYTSRNSLPSSPVAESQTQEEVVTTSSIAEIILKRSEQEFKCAPTSLQSPSITSSTTRNSTTQIYIVKKSKKELLHPPLKKTSQSTQQAIHNLYALSPSTIQKRQNYKPISPKGKQLSKGNGRKSGQILQRSNSLPLPTSSKKNNSRSVSHNNATKNAILMKLYGNSIRCGGQTLGRSKSLEPGLNQFSLHSRQVKSRETENTFDPLIVQQPTSSTAQRENQIIVTNKAEPDKQQRDNQAVVKTNAEHAKQQRHNQDVVENKAETDKQRILPKPSLFNGALPSNATSSQESNSPHPRLKSNETVEKILNEFYDNGHIGLWYRDPKATKRREMVVKSLARQLRRPPYPSRTHTHQVLHKLYWFHSLVKTGKWPNAKQRKPPF